MFLVSVPGSVLFLLFFYNVAMTEVDQYMMVVRVFMWGIFILMVVLFLIMDLFFGYMVISSIVSLKKHGRRSFDIITDEVDYKYEKTVHHTPGSYCHIEKTLHFHKCGDYRVGDTSYDIASEGDEYYVVVPCKDLSYALEIYPKKMYEYRE